MARIEDDIDVLVLLLSRSEGSHESLLLLLTIAGERLGSCPGMLECHRDSLITIFEALAHDSGRLGRILTRDVEVERRAFLEWSDTWGDVVSDVLEADVFGISSSWSVRVPGFPGRGAPSCGIGGEVSSSSSE